MDGSPGVSDEPLPSRYLRGVLNANRLRLGEEAQRLLATLAADAAALDTAERRAQVAQQPAVDPDRAAVEPLGHAVRPRQVARPQRRRQAVRRTVGVTDQLFLALKRRDRHDGAEDLLLVDAALYRQIDDQRRLDEKAVPAAPADRRGLAAAEDAPAFFPGEAQVGQHLVEMAFRDERALVGGRFQRVADLQPFRLGHEPLHEGGVRARLDEDA